MSNRGQPPQPQVVYIDADCPQVMLPYHALPPVAPDPATSPGPDARSVTLGLVTLWIVIAALLGAVLVLRGCSAP